MLSYINLAIFAHRTVRAETAEMSCEELEIRDFGHIFYFIICVSIYVPIQLQAQK